ncbi:MAG: hypothetical protein A2173_00250 [Planctomycetes bacterium RBG_13_44_8b]|nr:MAG: hypothetical protein A2173_00250 [Planctomycetes bacterium RBG_13_44_8b]
MTKYIKKFLSPNAGIKNFIIGFLLGLCIMLAAAAASSDNTLGIYQCCSSGDGSTGVFVIDTRTGHTWRLDRSDHYDYGTPQQRKSVRKTVIPYVE